MFVLDAVCARKGDALVLRWGDPERPHVALIDGGPGNVWATYLQPHLAQLAGHDAAGQPLSTNLDLVVVSHVDDDHIGGILNLVDHIDTCQKSGLPTRVEVAEVWHNAFKDLGSADEFGTASGWKEAVAAVAAAPSVLVDAGREAGETQADQASTGRIASEQSIRQGHRLEIALRAAGVPRNTRFADRGGLAREGALIELSGLKVRVMAPNAASIERLRDKWEREVANEPEADQKGVRALAASFDDPSVTNQSSIVLHVEYAGRTMLLTGDVRGDQLLEAVVQGGMNLPLHVDILKVPHHGSRHSNSAQLFEQIVADHYVISGNGEHGNPHPRTLQSLLDTQAGRTFTIYLTDRPDAGARRPQDVKAATKSQLILDHASNNIPNVSVVYRNPTTTAVSVSL